MSSQQTSRDSVSRRQFIAMGGSALAASTLLATSSCGDSSSGSSSDELTFAYWGSTYEKKAVAKALEGFQSSHKKSAKINRQFIPNSQYDTKMTALLASNKLPDLAYMGSNLAFRMAKQGKLANMLTHADKHPELAEFMPDIKFYWAPNKAFFSWALETMLLYYNADAFKEAHIDPPPASAQTAWTWKEFLHTARALTIDQNGKNGLDPKFDSKNVKQYGVYLNSITNFQIWYPLLLSNGGSFVDPKGAACKIDSPPAVQLFQDLQDLIYKYHACPTPASIGKTPPTTAIQLQSRRAAMAISGFWELLDLNGSKQHYGVGVLPRYKKPVTIATNSPMIVAKGSQHKHQAEAIDLLIYLSKPENVPLYSSGLWMPGLRKYYTDPKLIAKWQVANIPSQRFRSAIVDYTLKHAERDYHKWLKNPDKIDQTLTAALDPIALNKKPAKAALTAAKNKIVPLLQGAYPIAK